MAEITDEARVVALDRLWPGDIADRRGELLDVVFDWADFARLRRQVAAQCADAGLTGTRLDDFVLAVHEIAANAIVHAGAGGRLILRRAASGLRCLVADFPGATVSCPAPRSGDMRDASAATAEPREPREPGEPGEPGELGEPIGAVCGRGLWLAATLTDELSITSGPDSTIVSLYMRLE